MIASAVYALIAVICLAIASPAAGRMGVIVWLLQLLGLTLGRWLHGHGLRPWMPLLQIVISAVMAAYFGADVVALAALSSLAGLLVLWLALRLRSLAVVLLTLWPPVVALVVAGGQPADLQAAWSALVLALPLWICLDAGWRWGVVVVVTWLVTAASALGGEQRTSMSLLVEGWVIVAAVAQAGIVLLRLAPQISRLRSHWQGWVVGGGCLVAGALVLVVATEPWPGGWPVAAWVVLVIGTALAMAGLSGLTSAISSPALVYFEAQRTLALGTALGAVFTLGPFATARDPLLGLPIPLAPLAIAGLLALWLIAAGIWARVTRGRRSLDLSADIPLAVGAHVRRSLAKALAAAGTAAWAYVRGWRSPQRQLPLLIVIAAWSTFRELDTAAWLVVALGVVAVCLAPLLTALPVVWTIINCVMVGAGGHALGLPLEAALGAAALAPIAAWPFVRWRHLDPAWAFAAGLVVVSLAWRVLGGASFAHFSVTVVAGLVVLITNAVAPDRARGSMLGITTLWLLVFLATSIDQIDPFVRIQFQGAYLLHWTAPLGLRLPVLTIVLAVLWISRHRLRHPGWRSGRRWRVALAAIGCAAAAAWAVGLGDRWWVGVVAWLTLAVCTLPVVRELGDAQRRDVREPLIDALALALAILLSAAGRCWSLVEQAAVSRIEPGLLGDVVLAAFSDLVAITCAALLLMVTSFIIAKRRVVDRALLAAQSFGTLMIRRTSRYVRRDGIDP
ncbi:MAG: hypothetical protein ACYTF0_09370 [Planctomycetota bacterium]|jgi:hypothetical protein